MKTTPLTFPKRLLLCSIFLAGTAVTSFTTSTGNDVYICKGPQSKKYHYKKDCRGLSGCSTKIYAITLSEAKNLGRGLCGWED